MKFPILGLLPREGKRWQIGEKTAREYEKKKIEAISQLDIDSNASEDAE